MKTIVLANATIINGNRGCVALTVSLLYLIDMIFKKHSTPYKIYLPDSGHKIQSEYTYKINEVQIKYNICRYPIGINLKSWIKSLVKPKSFLQSINIIKNADYILDIGQGDSFADIYGVERFSIIDRIHKTARVFNKKYCILPQTIGPFSDPKILKKAKRSIKKASCVMARDKQSKDFVESNLPQTKINDYIDVAFLLPYNAKQFSKDKIHVGLNISALLWNGGYTRNNQFGLKDNYQNLNRAIIENFLANPNVIIHLTPHVVEGEYGIENDYEIGTQIIEEYNNDNLILSPFFLSPIDAKNYISGLDFFIGARMHATIAAISSGVPVYPLAYSRKFNGLFADTLNYNIMGDLKTQNNKEILTDLLKQFENRAIIKQEIEVIQKEIIKPKLEILERDLTDYFGFSRV